MRVGIVSFEYKCHCCLNPVLLAVEVESPSDYYIMDEFCPDCGRRLPDILDVSSAVAEFYAFANNAEEER